MGMVIYSIHPSHLLLFTSKKNFYTPKPPVVASAIYTQATLLSTTAGQITTNIASKVTSLSQSTNSEPTNTIGSTTSITSNCEPTNTIDSTTTITTYCEPTNASYREATSHHQRRERHMLSYPTRAIEFRHCHLPLYYDQSQAFEYQYYNPIDLQVLIHCGKTPPPGFQCPTQ
ncbi:proline rich protein 1 [Gossypium australe]|uniref:Proline rich protein 1 n=1 Tax=Gossypium australe TaxID=47621 RepID=A0A5B6V0D3_9ROSI|nr:proline rich protein 1 [Gossypium australe]